MDDLSASVITQNFVLSLVQYTERIRVPNSSASVLVFASSS